jgi:hypothetical protein
MSVKMFLSFLFNQVEESAEREFLEHVRSLKDGWFDRTVRRPVVGRMCDAVFSDSPWNTLLVLVVGAAMLVMFGSVLVVGGLWVHFSEQVRLPTILALIPLVAAFIRFYLDLTVIERILAGAGKGFDEWSRLYRLAQVREWLTRYQGYETSYRGWRYERG